MNRAAPGMAEPPEARMNDGGEGMADGEARKGVEGDSNGSLLQLIRNNLEVSLQSFGYLEPPQSPELEEISSGLQQLLQKVQQAEYLEEEALLAEMAGAEEETERST